MAETAVVILGAGSSAPFRVPTLRNIFKDPEAVRFLRKSPELRHTLESLFWQPRGIDLATSDRGPTIEDILTLLRDSEGQSFGIPRVIADDAELDRFRQLLYILIKKAVYDGKSSRECCLNSIIDWCRDHYEVTTWASFNWDCIFESSFWYSSGPPEARTNPTVVIDLKNWRSGSRKHEYLKLHGGVNWWLEDDEVTYLPFGYSQDLDEKWTAYENNSTEGRPLILEPSAYKYKDKAFDLLSSQWDLLATRLIEARTILVLGYSLPEGDERARSLLTLAFQQGRTDSKWFIVNQNSTTCERWRQLFGTARVQVQNLDVQTFGDRIELYLSG